MRLFVALNLPEEVRRQIDRCLAPHRGDTPVRWVNPDAIHLTLKFLGEVGEDREPAIAEMLAQAAAGVRPFEVAVSGFGFFPGVSRPKIVWAGCEPDPRLELLQHDVEKRLSQLGFEPDGRPFRPHLTVGRVRRNARRRDLRGLVDSLEGAELETGWYADRLDLMQSVQQRGGVRYELRHSHGLEG